MKLVITIAMAAILTAPLAAAPCKDAKGKFTKCPPAAGAAGMPSDIVKDKAGKCHWTATGNGHTKGQFVACPK